VRAVENRALVYKQTSKERCVVMDSIRELLTDDSKWHLVLYDFHDHFALQLLVAGIVISFILSFAVGANDSANSWGTSVGAGTVSLGWAYLLGSIMETLGATLLSGDVIKKVVNGIVNIEAYTSNKTMILDQYKPDDHEYDSSILEQEKILVLGCMSVMLGSGIWQLVASWFSWPVAGTHCIIFGLLGFTVAAKGSEGIENAEEFGQIVYMLFVSILASLIITAIFYYPLYRFCIRSGSPFTVKNKVVYGTLTGFSIGIPVSFILLQTNKAFHTISNLGFEDQKANLIIIGIGFGVSVVVTAVAIFYLLPHLQNMTGDFALNYDFRFWNKKKNEVEPNLVDVPRQLSNGGLDSELASYDVSVVAANRDAYKPDKDRGLHIKDSSELTRIFRPLQVISAMTSSLVHGGNDVANCIGPFVVIYTVYQEGILGGSGKAASAPWFISLWGGVGISLGLIFYGKKVIMTMGSGISEMTPSRGFCVEWVASLVGLVFTASGLMISTTHCKVGGLIGAGLMQGLVETGSPKEALTYVNFKVLSGVVLSWILTIPMSFGLSALIFLFLKAIII